MSAAATAAGYLYASGRLRGRGAKGEPQEPKQEQPPETKPPRERRPVRVAVYQPPEEQQSAAPEKPKRIPKIEYRTRRWRPGEEPR